MRSMLLAIATAFVSLVPLGAGAAHCESRIVVFSYPSGINSNGAVCLAAAETDALGYDGRLINPGSDSIGLAYVQDVGEPTLEARLDGLGFVDHAVTLTRQEPLPNLFVYYSELIPLPDGIMSSGCINARIDAIPDSTRYHTIDSSCP